MLMAFTTPQMPTPYYASPFLVMLRNYASAVEFTSVEPFSQELRLSSCLEMTYTTNVTPHADPMWHVDMSKAAPV